MNRTSLTRDTGIPCTNVYGLARSLIACCTLFAFVGHDMTELFFHYPGYTDAQHSGGFSRFSLYYLLGDHVVVAQFFSIAVLLAVVAGWRPRVTGVLHWYVSASFAASCLVVQGGDHVVANLTLILLPVTLLDGRRWHWAAPDETETWSAWKHAVVRSCFTVAALQVAVVYFFAGVAKMNVSEWSNGTAFYYWFTHPVFGAPTWFRTVLEPLLVYRPVVLAITWGTMVFEVFMAAGLLAKERFKPWMLGLGLLFHFGIVIVHGLFSFFFAMAGALVVYLVAPTLHLRVDRLLEAAPVRAIAVRLPRFRWAPAGSAPTPETKL
jgi:antimicrobial peptide system SdpB family protein